eukprot:TRINITY_DN865_c0_g1_i1.p1 TRINITY_DN865_c0_g1~~TRINITY_DN865_c0_g1_i1.p1  ORF type:complete len:255 (-),score=51.38 TRINITY_DN865_c0_g1_i1:21-677(-)
MPKHKRSKMVTLQSVTGKNSTEKKEKIVKGLQEAVDEYRTILVLSTENVRTTKMKEVRQQYPRSRFFFGKNRVISFTLGKDAESEIKPNLHQVSELLQGECVLMFTNEDKDEMIEFFKTFKEVDYARTGFIPTDTIIKHPGPIDLPHNLEPTIRTLGMPTKLRNGVIQLEGEYTLCTEGTPISSEQAQLLKMLDIKLAEFTINVKASWQNDGTFQLEQ